MGFRSFGTFLFGVICFFGNDAHGASSTPVAQTVFFICVQDNAQLAGRLKQELEAIPNVGATIGSCETAPKEFRFKEYQRGDEMVIVGYLQISNQTKKIVVDLRSNKRKGTVHQETDFSFIAEESSDRNIVVIGVELVRALLLSIENDPERQKQTVLPTQVVAPPTEEKREKSPRGGIVLHFNGVQPNLKMIPQLGLSAGGFWAITPTLDILLQGVFPVFPAQKEYDVGNIKLLSWFVLLEMTKRFSTKKVSPLGGIGGGLLISKISGDEGAEVTANEYHFYVPYFYGKLGLLFQTSDRLGFNADVTFGTGVNVPTIRPHREIEEISIFTPAFSVNLGARLALW